MATARNLIDAGGAAMFAAMPINAVAVDLSASSASSAFSAFAVATKTMSSEHRARAGRLLRQHPMHERHRDGSFSNSRRDALRASDSHITDGEHARQARLEQVRRASEGPLRRGEVFRQQVGARLDEALRIRR